MMVLLGKTAFWVGRWSLIVDREWRMSAKTAAASRKDAKSQRGSKIDRNWLEGGFCTYV
jgi:hypothetical protein